MSSHLSTPIGFTSNQLLFNETFNGTTLTAGNWNTFMTSNSTQGGAWDSDGRGGSGVGGVYDADYDEPDEVSVSDGLTLNAVQDTVLGADWTNNQVTPQTFPVVAGVVDTYGKVEFDGGYLQISMKEPGGDGSWPGLWLLPGAGAGNVGNNFEIDIQEGGFYDGSANPNDVMAYHLHTSAGVFGGVIDTGVDLTATFDTYAINWNPGKSITWYLNGSAVAEITSAEAPIPDEPMELIMNNQVATSAASSWRTSLDSATPLSMPMQVNGVQLYQAPSNGETIVGGNVLAGSPPSVAISRIGGVSALATQTIFGTVDLPDAGSTVSIYDGGVKIGSAQADAAGHWSTSVTLAYQGANVITATDTNAAGQGTSAPVNFTLHSSAPKIAISTKSQSVSQANQTVSGTVDLPDAGSTVSIYDGGVKLGSAQADAAGHWSTSVTLAYQGANVITATGTNAAGKGTSAPVNFTLHSSAPKIAISTKSQSVSQANQTVSGTVDLPDAGSTVSIYDGGVKLGSALADARGNWSTNITLIHQGANVVTAHASNIAGAGAPAAVNLNLVLPIQPTTIVDANANGQTFMLDNQNYKIALGGYSNHVTAGDGADDITPGMGNEQITLGNGLDRIILAGYGNRVTSGSGANTVSGGLGETTVKLGDGANTVKLSGDQNDVTVGNGANYIISGSSNAKILAGSGENRIVLDGFNNSVQLNGGRDVVVGGEGADQIILSGGTANFILRGVGERLNLIGANASIVDNGSKLFIDIASSVGRVDVAGFASDTSGIIQLLNGAGGYASVQDVLGALRSDNHGGSLLSLGANGSVDIMGLAPSHLNASNFAL